MLFTARTRPVLNRAVADMSWLLSRGYADASTLKLVGDRYNLSRRQRLAVMRSTCSDSQAQNRTARQVTADNIAGHILALDGYNVLITIEAALGSGVLLIGRDGCIRDLASIHGTYRRVAETRPAIEIIAASLTALAINSVLWYLDRPVSNSGRLKQIIEHYAAEHSLDWTVELLANPDKALIESNHIIASSDSVVLDGCTQWLNLAGYIIDSIGDICELHLLDIRGKTQA